MPSTTTFAFIAALQTKLQARVGLTGVPIYIVAPADTAPTTEQIELVRNRISVHQEYAALGRHRRNDINSIPCYLRTFKPAGAAGAQDSGSVFQAAGERAAALLEEVVQQLVTDAPAVGDQTIIAQVGETSYLPIPADAGGWIVEVDFAIDYTARVS